MRLEGKVALISGGARGIGAAMSTRFAAEGAHVCIGDIEDAAGIALAETIQAAGQDARFMRLDVIDSAAWQAAVDALVADFGGIDILVNNAGIYDRRPLEEISEESWDRVMGVNAKGPFLGAKAVIPAMRMKGGGSIVNISSTAGIRGSVASHYGASKGAVRLLTKSIAGTYAKDGIRCNSVHPGPVETEMGYAAVPEAVRAERFGRIPLGRFADPSEIANAVLFLASGEASFMTGSEMVVDGGSTAV
jgi:NAD(P)-dependent dehydrogenase (short-subunit alcohol dehydrogenase family)